MFSDKASNEDKAEKVPAQYNRIKSKWNFFKEAETFGSKQSLFGSQFLASREGIVHEKKDAGGIQGF